MILFDRLEGPLPRLALLHPRGAFAAAAALGSLRNRVSRRWPSPEQVRTLFPHLTLPQAARVAWEIAAAEARNRVLVECLRRAGAAPVRPLVRAHGAFAALRPPVLFGTFHVGALHALGPVVERLPGPVLAFRLGRLYEVGPAVEVVSTEGDEQGRAAVFHQALAHLRAGGFVVMALDVVPGEGLSTSCLGHPLELARGPFALARIAGVPLVPLAARWRPDGIEALTGEEISSTGSEAAMAAAAAVWLDGYLRENPAEISLGLLRTLLRAD